MTKERKAAFLLRTVLFFGLFFILFFIVCRIFLYKDNNFYNYQNYIRQDENSVDVIAMGSSHCIDAVDATALKEAVKEKSGVEASVFNLSVTGMRIEQIAYRLEEALKTQKPKLLIIETFSFAPMELGDEEVTRRYALDYMPLTPEKAKFIESHIEAGKSSFYLPFIKYHTRWKELGKEDFLALSKRWVGEKGSLNGLAVGDKPDYNKERDDYFEQDFSLITECQEPTAQQQDSIAHILKLAEENGSKVLFLSVPYKVQMDFPSTELIPYNNYIKENYVDNEKVFLLDMNRIMDDLDWSYDYMQDEGHVNNKGRELVTEYLSEYISSSLADYFGD